MPLTVQCYDRDGCFDEFMLFCKIEKMNLITWIRDTLACLQEHLLVAYNQPGVDWITKLTIKYEFLHMVPGWYIYPWAFEVEAVLSLSAFVRSSVRPSARKFYFARTMTQHNFWLESPLWQLTCIGDTLSWYWKLMSQALIFEVILAILITKSAPNMHRGIFAASIENWGYWPWPSKSLGHFDSEF